MNQLRQKDVTGTPQHGGRYAAQTFTPDTITLPTAPAWAGQISMPVSVMRGNVTPEMVRQEVAERHRNREIRDITAVSIARTLGDWDRPNLVLLGRTGQGDKEAIYAELDELNQNSWSESDDHIFQVKALMTWVTAGGDND